MKLVTYQTEGQTRLGALAADDRLVVDLSGVEVSGRILTSMMDLITGGERALDVVRRVVDEPSGRTVHDLASVRLVAPLKPPRIRDLGVVTAHLRAAFAEMARRIVGPDEAAVEAEIAAMVERFGLDRPVRRPALTLRDAATVSGPDDVVETPPYSNELDYELELGMVVGRGGRGIAEERAGEHIFGYTIFNDWTARDRQVRNHRLGIGLNDDAKDFDGSNGLGPCIVTRDAMPDLSTLEGVVRVDGEEWSRGRYDEALFSWEYTIQVLSRDRSIFPGEVWGSGTLRSGTAFEQGRRLPAECVVELELQPIGVLRNIVRGNAAT